MDHFLIKNSNKNKISANQNTYVYVHVLACPCGRRMLGWRWGCRVPPFPKSKQVQLITPLK